MESVTTELHEELSTTRMPI